VPGKASCGFTLLFALQDSVDPVTELVRFDQLHIVHCLDDALTATLKVGG
jgi:hypothetical protein